MVNRAVSIFAACLLSIPANAHHSFAAEFLGDQTRTIRGVVTEVWFKDPHVRYYVEITNEDGDKEFWDVRTSSPSLLVRRGWTRNSIREGDRVTIEGHVGRNGRKLLSLIRLELTDGTVYGSGY